MIEKLEDLGIVEKDKEEDIDKKIQEKLGLGLTELKQALSLSIQEKADELVADIINIVPFGDYSKILEDKADMAKFMREEAIDPKHWQLYVVEVTEHGMIKFMFVCTAVDDGDTMQGLVFVSNSGKIRHAFAQSSA